MKNKIKTFFKYSFLIIFLFGIISLIILQSTITIKDEKLTSISQEMIEPKIIVLSESQNGFYKDRYLIIYDNKDKSKIELFDLKTKETKLLPKPTLKGENQTLIGGETLYNINIVKSNSNDTFGIEFFDLNSFTWKKLKTIPTIRKKANDMPSVQITDWLGKERVFIWGGINNKTNKQQSILEVIDLKEDKLIIKEYFPFQGGKFDFSFRFRKFIGHKTDENYNKTKLTYEKYHYYIWLLSFDKKCKFSNLYYKERYLKYDGLFDFLASPLEFVVVGAATENGEFYELISLDSLGKNEDEIYKKRIVLPKKYQNYNIEHLVVKDCIYKPNLLLVLKNGNKQEFLRLSSVFYKTKKEDFKSGFLSTYVYKNLSEIKGNLDFAQFVESYENLNGRSLKYSAYTVDNNKIYKIKIIR